MTQRYQRSHGIWGQQLLVIEEHELVQLSCECMGHTMFCVLHDDGFGAQCGTGRTVVTCLDRAGTTNNGESE